MWKAGWQSSDDPPRTDRRSGLTLIELMVVVVVMGVLAGALVPNLVTAANRMGMEQAVTEVQDLLDFAAAASVARRHPVHVVFDPEHNGCRVCLCVTQLPWLLEEECAPASVLANVGLPDGVEVAVVHTASGDTARRWQGEAGTVRFWPDGSADEAELELSDAHGRSEVVAVRAIAGEVVMIEEE